VKALVIMIIRRLYTAYAFLAFLDQDDLLPQQLRPLLSEHGRFPTRRTWERRLAALAPSAFARPDRLRGALPGVPAPAVGHAGAGCGGR